MQTQLAKRPLFPSIGLVSLISSGGQMLQNEKDALINATLRRALATMLLIHEGAIEIASSGFVIDLTCDIEGLRMALKLLSDFNEEQGTKLSTQLLQ
jgi:hypothetical protein